MPCVKHLGSSKTSVARSRSCRLFESNSRPRRTVFRPRWLTCRMLSGTLRRVWKLPTITLLSSGLNLSADYVKRTTRSMAFGIACSFI